MYVDILHNVVLSDYIFFFIKLKLRYIHFIEMHLCIPNLKKLILYTLCNICTIVEFKDDLKKACSNSVAP